MDMYQFARWGEDLDREFLGSSDRAAAVVGAAMLDAQLKILFEARIAQKADRSQLFDGTNAPLHSLSGKADLALALGMISEREHRNLTLIRRIRNAFAHKIGELSFATPGISSRCDELEVPIGMRLPAQIPSALIADENLRSIRITGGAVRYAEGSLSGSRGVRLQLLPRASDGTDGDGGRAKTGVRAHERDFRSAVERLRQSERLFEAETSPSRSTARTLRET